MKKGIDFIGVAVGAIILNDKHEILLTKRSQNAKNERGCWEAPGGSIEFGETMEAAIKREMKEELGIEVDILKQFPAKDHMLPAEKQHWVATTFLVKIKNDQIPKIMEKDKCDGIGWYSISNLPNPLSVITKIDLEEFKEEINAEI